MTNFEKICKGTPEELADLFHDDEGCTRCVCINACTYDCKEGLINWLNSPAPIELTQTEREICVGLKHLEYKYLIRNSNGVLRATVGKPRKTNTVEWRSDDYHYINKSEAFSFIKWEDDEPTRIDDLLEGKQ